MNLLLLPGAGNPEAVPLYSDVYDLLRNEAERWGFGIFVDSVRWPGQCDPASRGTTPCLTVASAIEVAVDAVEAMPPGPFCILARSFGCTVALKAMEHERRSRTPERLILWGPPAFWRLWELFGRDIGPSQAKAQSKGVRIDASYWASLEPTESLLRRVRVPTIVAAGTDDVLCDSAFRNYLEELCLGNPAVVVRPVVSGGVHEVTAASGSAVVAAYSEALFAPP